ncbi:L-type lectin-domain containing receptor kinase S.1 [Argentina anserina]|uniref:L-type lectin-domain containing receptor kinase S.1 n=1 Tax=Argentina anserina TaxID=57926 RepID=UPI0021764AD9|nr:L-type lectin-domain containing receptor kinase S.1 [Potentilla anserina]
MRPLPFRLLLLFHLLSPTLALEFLFNSSNITNATDFTLINDAKLDGAAVRLTNDSVQYSLGRFFHTTKITMRPNSTSASLTSFSTSFVFSDLPKIASSPGFGLCFFLSNSTSPPNALASQYFGLFSNATVPVVAPLLAVEFDTGRNPEFNDPDGNHIGIDLNNIESAKTSPAGYFNSSGGFVPVQMRSGENIRTWIDFDGENLEINVTVAPASLPRPSRPTLSFKDPTIANYVSSEMFVGFSASKTTWIEAQRILAWSFSDTGVAKEINVTSLPVYEVGTSSKSLSKGAIAGITIACIVFVVVLASGVYLYWRKMKMEDEEDDEIEDWEMEYWPHRFSNEELSVATGGFSKDQLLGSGGFGKVYWGVLSNKTEIAVKCVNHDSKQGLREFMAEISSMGRLQHKNLVQMRGWCRKGNELMLVYDYMPNGSLNKWIFDKPKQVLGWGQRRRVLADVAEGMNYLHYGWEKMVVHRDIKSSNILLDLEMRGRLGDFGLAKLYEHGEVPNTTRVVGTLGYMAPELATLAAPTAASDVYSFGVVLLEVACGRKPIEMEAEEEEEEVLVDWVRELYFKGRVREAADQRIKGEYDEEEMEIALKLGLSCCHPDPHRRPNMKEIVTILVGETGSGPAPASLLSELARGESGNVAGSGEESGEVAFRPQHSA